MEVRVLKMHKNFHGLLVLFHLPAIQTIRRTSGLIGVRYAYWTQEYLQNINRSVPKEIIEIKLTKRLRSRKIKHISIFNLTYYGPFTEPFLIKIHYNLVFRNYLSEAEQNRNCTREQSPELEL